MDAQRSSCDDAHSDVSSGAAASMSKNTAPRVRLMHKADAQSSSSPNQDHAAAVGLADCYSTAAVCMSRGGSRK